MQKTEFNVRISGGPNKWRTVTGQVYGQLGVHKEEGAGACYFVTALMSGKRVYWFHLQGDAIRFARLVGEEPIFIKATTRADGMFDGTVLYEMLIRRNINVDEFKRGYLVFNQLPDEVE